METRMNRVGEVYEPFKVRFIRRPVRKLSPDEVLIAVKASAICGSDLHIARGKHPSAPLPVTIGHEFSGQVVEVGSEELQDRLGQRVTVEPCIVCGKCDACRHGQYGYCEHITFTYRNGEGAMADYVVIKAPYVYELPDYLTYETGALIEPLSVATHAVRRADVKLGETVLVIGDGAIGLLTAAMCRRAGAARVIVAGHSASKLKLARESGATDTIDTHETDPVDYALEMTKGKGADKTFECVGRQECLEQAVMALRRNGLCTVIGIYEDKNITFPMSRLITHEIRVQGAQGYCWDFPVAIAAARDIPLEKFITHTFPLDQLQQALDTALDKKSGAVKVILKP